MPLPQTLPLDSQLLRAEFPAFEEPTLKGQAFFENAGGSYTCRQVLGRLEHYYRAHKVQPYGAFQASQQAGKAMDLAFDRMASALNVSSDWIQFGPSTSANTYFLAQAFHTFLTPGGTIIVTNQDHEANSGVWRRLARMGAVIREWQVNPDTGHLDPGDLDDLLDDTVKLVAFPHCSNMVGEINPVAQICAKIASAGAISLVDGVSYAPHGLPDLKDLGADIYLFSAYKVYGPHQGVMAIRPELAERLPNQGHYFNETKPRYRLTPAGPDHAQIAAAAGIVDYLERVSDIAGNSVAETDPFRRAHAAMRQQEIILMQPLLDWLQGSNRLRLIGPVSAAMRAPTFSLKLAAPGFEVAQRLAKRSIMATGGHFYARRLIEAMGLDPDHGLLRVSFTHYTTPDEIQALIAALDAELK